MSGRIVEARAVAPVRGWRWLVEGFLLFRRSPIVWISLTLALVLIWLLSLAVPVLGPLLFNLFSPVFFAGLMLGCRALERGEPLGIAHLFAGFRGRAAPLVTVGGVYLVGTIMVIGLVLLATDSSKLAGALSAPAGDPEAMRAGLRAAAAAFAIGAAAYVPLLMLIWFAPLLVVFDGLAPVEAMKLSFAACLRNVAAFLVYGLAVLALWLALSLPAAFGAAGAVLAIALLLASIPVLVCSIYASYQDLFTARNSSATSPANS